MRGFTLVELIVVTTIIALMSAITLVRLPALTAQSHVNVAVNQVLQTARDARHRSSSVEEFNGRFPSYGLHFSMSSSQKVIMYADCTIDDNGDGILNQTDRFYYEAASCGGSSVKSEIQLQKGTRIKEIRRVPGSAKQQAFVEFVRPDPTTWLTDAQTLGGPYFLLETGHLEVDISDMSGNHTKTIQFWSSGKITTS
jgi:prepilin-type N-terminal cleavage/methylation domain-containing protein